MAEVNGGVLVARQLKQAGIDSDAMLAKRKEVIAQRQAQSVAINPKLNGTLVRIPGYVLPLEYKGKQVSEFLLVPWVGAWSPTTMRATVDLPQPDSPTIE